MEGAKPHAEVAHALDPARAAAVSAELDRILASPAFRNAHRSQEFLRYVVHNALEGRYELLKERSVGAGVFNRAPDYDTGDDSIVRVKASELRKRLAQYYLESGAGDEVVIELPAGSYVPEFRWRERPGSAQAAHRRAPKPAWLIAAGGLVVAAAATLAVLWFARAPAPSALDRFWEPVFASPRPVLLCVANPGVFLLRPPGRTAFDNGRPVPAGEIVADNDRYVGFGDAFALARMSAFLSARGKRISLRMGSDTSFADLRDQPAVLIGAFSNQWTMQLTSRYRFLFDHADGHPIVRDVATGEIWRRDPARPGFDYAILSRVFDSRSGEMVITAAGLAHAGTQMAGEFLTNAAYFEQAVREAPRDWPRRNLQLVIAGEVIGKTPGPPRVAASFTW